MVRSRGRFVVAGGAMLATTGALYLWTSPQDWAALHKQSLESLRQLSFTTFSNGATCSAEPGPSSSAATDAVELVRVAADDAQYRLVHARPPATPDFRPLQTSPSLPGDCLDAFVGEGKPCGAPDAPSPTFDFVWTWSNGSEALHRAAYLAYERSTLPVGSKSIADQPSRLKLFREHDELRHSFRSVLQHFRPHVNRIHLVTGDLPVPNDEGNDTYVINTQDQESAPCPHARQTQTVPRLGQVPAWLNTSQPDGDVQIDVTHHSQYFSQYTDTVFNSLAIESQFPNLRNLHDQFIYMNDDFFFSADLIPADFATHAFGTVFRVYPSRVLQPTSFRDPSSSAQAAETVALEWSSEIISRRFGFRSRPYPSHESKAVSTPLFRELAALFPDALSQSARARVRSMTGSKVTNVHMMALYLHFVVERHREAALWSWAVARMTQIATRGEEDWAEVAWEEIGGAPRAKSVNVRARRRNTLSRPHLRDVLGEEVGEYAYTAYRFSSDDGYPYASLGEKGYKAWPDMKSVTKTATHPHYGCKVERTRCFPTRDDLAAGYSPADFFQHIAFVDVTCGDCILTSLVAESGELGLNAVLPDAPEELNSTLAKTFDEAPHLPLVSDFMDGDFSVEAVVPPNADLRAWSVQLVHRYRYVIGRIFSGFSMLKNPEQAVDEFKRLEKDIKSGWMGVVCINDDIVKGAPEVDKSFREWQESHWPQPAQWEMY